MKGPSDDVMGEVHKPKSSEPVNVVSDTSATATTTTTTHSINAFFHDDDDDDDLFEEESKSKQTTDVMMDLYEQDLPGEVAAAPGLMTTEEPKLGHFEKKEKKRIQKDPEKLKAFEERIQKRANDARIKQTQEKLAYLDKLGKEHHNMFAEATPIYEAVQKDVEDGLDSLRIYTAQYYKNMNDGLRFGKWQRYAESTPKFFCEQTVNAIKALNHEKCRVKTDLSVRRDMDMKGLMAMFGLQSTGDVDQDVNTILSQSHLDDGTRILHDKGFLSTTMRQSGEDRFKKNVICRILVPKGTTGLFVGGISVNTAEGELLLQANTKHRLLKVEKHHPPDSVPLVVYMEAIPGNVFSKEKIEAMERRAQAMAD